MSKEKLARFKFIYDAMFSVNFLAVIANDFIHTGLHEFNIQCYSYNIAMPIFSTLVL